ncbi:AAA family ATPase [Streptomyces sp. NPDC046915]|uniref:AAA family ATPase n=1 Tax=Streptomyces sp. NPDC046915 TaxID=3155257 RepID=UPI0033FB719C
MSGRSATAVKGRLMTEAADRTSVAGALETVLATCAVGRSRVVVIEGAAGCGKSHLLAAVAERAAAVGALVLTAAATEDGRRVSLGVLRQLAGTATVFALPRREEAGAEFCAQLCALAADGPVVLCVDDVQHTDPQSLRYLRHLAQHARPAPVLLVVAVSAQASADDAAFVTELTGRPHVRRITLGPLSLQETSDAVAGRSRGAVSELYRISGGNPLLLRALTEEWQAADSTADPAGAVTVAPDGPFAAAVATCLAHSGPAAVASARAVAILGERAAEPVLARLVGAGAGAEVPGLAALRSCGLLDGLRFRHPVVRDVVLERTPPRTRAGLHRRAALALRETGATASVVAGHFLAPIADGIRRPARPGDLEVLRDLAEELLAQRRPDESERILELAHDVCPDATSRTAVELRLTEISVWPDSAARIVEREPLNGPEQRVAALAARGLTNRQIATALLLSVSTVEQRLTRIYRKLRVQGRAELPAALVQGARAAAVIA